jgi:hypothetical protein
MKVYMVTSGDYSSFGVDGIFSTKEKAQEFIDYITKGNPEHDYHPPEPIEVDEPLSYVGSKDLWQGYMDIDGNHIIEPKICNDQYKWIDHYEFAIFKNKEILGLNYIVKAESREKAIKIANDKRANLIALNNFVDKYVEAN